MSSKEILFIGNSYTQCNDMPKIVSYFAKQIGIDLNFCMIVLGGQTFEGHLFNKDARLTLEKYKEKKWDFLVMQEMSIRPIVDPEKMFEYGQKLATLVKRDNTCVYQTWARQFYPETQSKLNESYSKFANLINAMIAPAGMAWEIIINTYPEIELFTEDLSHPTFIGSYISACAIFCTLFETTCAGLPNSIPFTKNTMLTIDKDVCEKLHLAVEAALKKV